jgi:hypothetical protein
MVAGISAISLSVMPREHKVVTEVTKVKGMWAMRKQGA